MQHYVVYLDEFGHIGPYVARDHANVFHKYFHDRVRDVALVSSGIRPPVEVLASGPVSELG